MQKQKRGRQLSRNRDQRIALLKILAGNLILKERIKTTIAKAKETAPLVEKIITRAKKQNLASRRILISMLSKKAATKAFKELGPRYLERKGGYTRIIKLGPRLSDATEMVILELVK
ncbi:MAG: 50S ribosomal protein L17 [Parcubacteria group bacterium CG_4_10_14_0_2_um_filter_7_35_8]|nr:MAG: 50S ribosomal protein L17 [Parcubacteria group bacterium CG23_combo_of_CG06-09_8_20_14_all_35_6]PIR58295.1 MAG: 50S ribosomal protein L17 [Parcubacteria group bacterium CG10_big_fil_rev_8_21_14_0_10_35_15]PIZ77031.1 MAG: 50S ribosomal protein L17 [Parcubacteria group bacterium CG_4_10_14_0_2_um_filter_7_35_8]